MYGWVKTFIKIKTKENSHYNDTVRATYQDLVMMGVGINNIDKVVHTKSRGLCKLQAAESLLKTLW